MLEDPDVDAIFGTHCMPALEVGKIGYTGARCGRAPTCSRSRFAARSRTARIRTRGGCGAHRQPRGVALQSVVSRRIDARDSCVVTVGQIEAGNSYNILAESAKLTGILRSLSEDRLRARQGTSRAACEGVCRGMGAECEVALRRARAPTSTISSSSPGRRTAARARWGDDVVAHPPQLGAEDFAAFSRRVPGCYLFLGIRNEDARHHPPSPHAAL